MLWREAEVEGCEVCGGGLEEGVKDGGDGLHGGCQVGHRSRVEVEVQGC